MSSRKHGRIVSRLEHTCSMSPPSTLWSIFTITIPQDHPVPQHLQRVHTRTLGPACPSLVPARTTHASTLACRGRTSTPSSHKNSSQHELTSSPPQIQRWTLSDLYTLITKNNSHTNILLDEYNNEKLKFVWKNEIDWKWKTKTQDNHSR